MNGKIGEYWLAEEQSDIVYKILYECAVGHWIVQRFTLISTDHWKYTALEDHALDRLATEEEIKEALLRTTH